MEKCLSSAFPCFSTDQFRGYSPAKLTCSYQSMLYFTLIIVFHWLLHFCRMSAQFYCNLIKLHPIMHPSSVLLLCPYLLHDFLLLPFHSLQFTPHFFSAVPPGQFCYGKIFKLSSKIFRILLYFKNQSWNFCFNCI